MQKCRILAHRGASGEAPENTRTAFLLAAEEGAYGIETDVRLTADDEIVIVHDEDLARLCGVEGKVSDYRLAELRQMNFAWHVEGAEAERIMTLAELLALVREKNLYANIEIKHSYKYFYKYRNLATRTARQVIEAGMAEQVILSSFVFPYMMRVKRRFPELACGFLFENHHRVTFGLAKHYGIEALHPAKDLVTKDFVQKAHDRGLQVNTWTVNEEEEIAKMRDLGVDLIITNFPARALAVIEEATDS